MRPGESPEEGPEMVCTTRILFRKILDELQRHESMDLATIGEIDEEVLEYLTNAANSQVKILEQWRSALPLHLAWDDKEPPSTDPLRASLRAEYYSGVTKLLRPYLEIVKIFECFPATVEKLTAGQRGLIGVVYSWVQGALSSIVALDRIGAVANSVYEPYRSTSSSQIMLSNPVKTLHAQVASSFICYF